MVISQEMLWPSNNEFNLTIVYLNFHSNLLGGNELPFHMHNHSPCKDDTGSWNHSSWTVLHLEGGDGEICPLFDWAAPSYLGKGQQPPLEILIIYIRFNINSTCLWQSCPPDTEEGGGWCPSFPNKTPLYIYIYYIYISSMPNTTTPCITKASAAMILTLLSQNMLVSTPKVFGVVSSEGS